MRALHVARHAAAVLLACGLMAPGGDAAAAPAKSRIPLAVIVNRSNPIESIAAAELRRLFLGAHTTWPHGRRVTPVLRQPRQPERAAALRLIYGMSEDDMTRHFDLRTFAGGAAAAPRAMATPEGVRRFVFNVPGAIGVIRLADVDDTVKVLRIDGAAPGDLHYPLVMSES
jgi:ABC-type phosphate transport system substrate-binding protein